MMDFLQRKASICGFPPICDKGKAGMQQNKEKAEQLAVLAAARPRLQESGQAKPSGKFSLHASVKREKSS